MTDCPECQAYMALPDFNAACAKIAVVHSMGIDQVRASTVQWFHEMEHDPIRNAHPAELIAAFRGARRTIERFRQ